MQRITTQRFVRKPLFVEVVRVTGANLDAVADWCQGQVLQDEVPGKGTSKKYVKVRVHHPRDPRQTKAFVGDWILYTDRGYKVYTNKAFLASFDPVEATTDESPKKEFPYEDGDTIVLGPECFVAKDGEVLNWKGQNYVPQGAVMEKAA